MDSFSNISNVSNVSNIYRYKFEKEFADGLYIFAKVHQYDDRHTFKEAWMAWSDEHENLIQGEVRRLMSLGYEGNILDKMYKSARYYFRNKSTEKKPPANRKKYTTIEKDLLKHMDNHIRTHYTDDDYKPSSGFDDFCMKNVELLKEQVEFLYKNGITDANEIKNKVKKTYKNRYFLAIVSNNK
jgi:hypothetical protein